MPNAHLTLLLLLCAVQFARSSPRYKELYLSNELLGVSKAYELKPACLNIARQVEKYCMARRIQPDLKEVRHPL
jgi:uncharacterized membrane protein YbaN (DUF454 family)